MLQKDETSHEDIFDVKLKQFKEDALAYARTLHMDNADEYIKLLCVFDNCLRRTTTKRPNPDDDEDADDEYRTDIGEVGEKVYELSHAICDLTSRIERELDIAKAAKKNCFFNLDAPK